LIVAGAESIPQRGSARHFKNGNMAGNRPKTAHRFQMTGEDADPLKLQQAEFVIFFTNFDSVIFKLLIANEK